MLTMRRSNLVVLLLALVMGSVAALMARSWIDRHTSPQAEVVTNTILVAAAPLPFGTILAENNVSEIPWAGPQIPEGAFAKKIDLLKDGRRIVLSPMERSEMIIRPKVTAPGQRASLSVLLEEGQRAVTVRVDDIRGVAGFILPGDRVDVMLLRTETRQGETENSADVLLEYVKVLAIDQVLNDRPDQPTVATVAKAVTLQVSPEQAQKLLLAGNVGKLSLVLRQPAEGPMAEGRRITERDLPGVARRETSAAPIAKISTPAPPKERQDRTKVSIYHGMDLKTYDVVHEGND
jgi:pilus assembly protein CpaB